MENKEKYKILFNIFIEIIRNNKNTIIFRKTFFERYFQIAFVFEKRYVHK